MAILSISGEVGCRAEELARFIAQRLGWELVIDSSLTKLIASEFPDMTNVPDRAWPFLTAAVLVRLAAHSHLIYSLPGGQFLLPSLAGVFRLHLAASESLRIGSIMVDLRLDRTTARRWLRDREAEQAKHRRQRFGKSTLRMHEVDMILNVETFDLEQQMTAIEAALRSRNLLPGEFLSGAAEAQVLFQIRLKLARFGLAPPSAVTIQHPEFSHPSEQIFTKLLDFYGIAWEYEPRSFPLQWDKDGKVVEAFTPDFYLPEFDLYLELTTMKQALVTRKNRKIKLLRRIYPHVNIQVFYQKDIQDLILKYGLPRSAEGL